MQALIMIEDPRDECRQNVALNKITTQSTDCVGYEGASYLAVDGNTTTDFGEKKPHACSCAKGTSSTFWSVDLGKPYPLHNIRIFHRNNGVVEFGDLAMEVKQTSTSGHMAYLVVQS
ncbi:uncharacterized protein LOC121366096 [Gigantopelta aegis]|uniref:uncharacterized protein LOC121366096 n=1 Tax=Gigantopelta aegis TaxID=1735272 RepID=UPI001B888371|nr:uncharacterized protein LOC121366096 [Gigantopelta aegis]